MMQVSAAVRVMPCPPARVDSRKTKPSLPSAAGAGRAADRAGWENCRWRPPAKNTKAHTHIHTRRHTHAPPLEKRSMAACRSRDAVDPSMRSQGYPLCTGQGTAGAAGAAGLAGWRRGQQARGAELGGGGSAGGAGRCKWECCYSHRRCGGAAHQVQPVLQHIQHDLELGEDEDLCEDTGQNGTESASRRRAAALVHRAPGGSRHSPEAPQHTLCPSALSLGSSLCRRTILPLACRGRAGRRHGGRQGAG